VTDTSKPDSPADAERLLRLALAVEARAEQRVRRRIQIGAYGFLALFVLGFLLTAFFSR
jgi:hypothetical protein